METVRVVALITACQVLLLSPTSQAREIVVGAMMYESLMIGPTSSYGHFRVASAINIALDRVKREGLLGNNTVRLLTARESCGPKKAIAHLIEWTQQEKIDVLIGPACSFAMISMGFYVSVLNIPWFPFGGISFDLSDKKIYNTLVRVQSIMEKSTLAVVTAFRYYNWRRVAMLSSDSHCDLTATALSEQLRRHDVLLAEWIRTTSGLTPGRANDFLNRLKARARIIFLCLTSSDLRVFMHQAQERGFGAPDYVFWRSSTLPSDSTYYPWGSSPEDASYDRQAAWLSLKQLTTPIVSGPEITAFYNDIPLRLMDPPWNNNYSYIHNLTGSFQAAVLHDATYLYFLLLNETLEEQKDWRNGSLFFEKAKHRRFNGIAGTILMDEDADSIRDQWVWSLAPGQTKMEPVLHLHMTDPQNVVVEPIGSPYWGTADNKPPPDTPPCGFQNEFCPEDTTGRTVAAITVPLLSLLLILVIAGYIIYSRRRQFELDLQRMLWKIHYKDIHSLKARRGSLVALSQRSVLGSQPSTVIELDANRQMFTTVGVYRGLLVAVRMVGKGPIVLSNEDLLELKEMRDMNHENVNQFIGACIDPGNTCYLMQYCSKGSLMDILENEDIKLDWLFKASLIADLASGISYLHRSKLQSHGNLRSSNCLVDSRWVLKVSSYGLRAFKSDMYQVDGQTDESSLYQKLLWTAPELLRMNVKPFYGTQKGDVYSFAIIVREVVYRRTPQSIAERTPKEIIELIMRVGSEPFRPPLGKLDHDVNPKVLDLVRACWAEDPCSRPDFQTINKKLRELNAGRNVNILDSMVNKLEAYANNLEEIVEQRTQELSEEKKKTDRLLYRMLPEVVAERLKQGQTVEPVLYEKVTVFFSDIVGFTALSSESTPIQIVDLLNDLYTLFDHIISLHKVYKVETIGDAYMVVSGLPERQGDRHAREIANMSLDLLRAVNTQFKVRHLPDRRLKLRSGIHTGPCAAGVVGLTMPRYCLFGDTVNTASRMESNGEALKIHLSEATYEELKKTPLYIMAPRGLLEIKGKGQQMTYWLISKKRIV